MMILTAAKAAGAAVVGGLALGSGRNMLQTYNVKQTSDHPACAAAAQTTVSDLEVLSRKELLQLYLSSEAPTDLAVLEGHWNGVLLKNNRLLMTFVTRFISNRLFGKGRLWNGKAFDTNAMKGSNRFERYSLEKCKKVKDKVTVTLATETDRSFDFSIQPSCLQPDNKCVTLTYSPHNKLPWKSMIDELRIVRGSDNEDILIGIGWMGWSGGTLNASPFCLYRNRQL